MAILNPDCSFAERSFARLRARRLRVSPFTMLTTETETIESNQF